MAKVELTVPARNDLDAIWDFIAADSLQNADRLIARIESTSALYAQQPEMGAPADRFKPGLRFFVLGAYVVFYRPSPDGILVIRVLHGSQDLRALFASDSSARTEPRE